MVSNGRCQLWCFLSLKKKDSEFSGWELAVVVIAYRVVVEETDDIGFALQLQNSSLLLPSSGSSIKDVGIFWAIFYTPSPMSEL